MKRSKVMYLSLLALTCVALAGGALGIVFDCGRARVFGMTTLKSYVPDLRLRWNEVCCAHKRVNSFHVWHGDVRVPGYCSIEGSINGKATIREPGDELVHAYPPWHNFFFYFYGWLPFNACAALMYCVFGLSLAIILNETWRQFSSCKDCQSLLGLYSFSLVTFPVGCCFFWCNYSVLILALLVLVFRSLRRGNQILAGLLWSVALIKPQLAALFFWPFLFSRQYRTILTAMIMCGVATCVMGVIYDESPVDLILQIPQLAIPELGNVYQMMFVSLLGGWAKWAWTVFWFVVCGVLSFELRTRESWFERCAPSVVCMLLWSFNQPHDAVLLLVWYCVVGTRICARLKYGGMWLFYGCLSLAVYAFTSVWSAFSLTGLLCVSGLGWIWHLVSLVWYFATFSLLVILCKESSSKCIEREGCCVIDAN